MNDIFNKKLIAFQSVDKEGDIWCNYALLFETEKEVEDFFNDKEKVVEILELEFNHDAGESIETFMEIKRGGSGFISVVKIRLEYCGIMHIERMSDGFLIKKI